MSKAMRIHKPGGPESMQWEDVEIGKPGAGEVQVRHRAVGLNYLDVYNRTGLYPNPLPLMVGHEGSGVVEAVGAGGTDLKVGDRVAYGAGPIGAYCEVRNMPAGRLVTLPEAIDFEHGAAMMLQGMTVQYLLQRTFKVLSGQTILFHAAAGGVGLIACQWAKALGLQLIGTAGSAAKCELALASGAADQHHAGNIQAHHEQHGCGQREDGEKHTLALGLTDCALRVVRLNGRALVLIGRRILPGDDVHRGRL